MPSPDQPAHRAAPDVMPPDWLVLAALMALAAALRFWRLADVPPGFHVDEAFNVLDARAVLGGWRPLFLPANAGREVLYTYLQAALMAVFGDGLATARAASALAGTLAVPATWWAARAIEPAGHAAHHGRTALVAAALMATTYWAVHFGRFGIRAILLAPLAALALGAWARALAAPPERRRSWAVGTGLLLGLALYSHPAGRGLWLVPALHVVARVPRARSGAGLGVLGTALAAFAVSAAPLVAWWLANPGTAMGHAAEVQVVGHGLGALWQNALAVAGMFNVAGDAAPWRNLPGRPAFDPFVGLPFVLGMAVVAANAARGRDGAVLLLLWLVGLSAPSVLADAAPNFSRAIGALPAACLVAAVGFERLARLWPEPRAALLLVAALGLSGVLSARDYFGRWAVDPATPLAFDADVRALALATDRLAAEGNAVLLSPATADHATVRAVARSAPRGLDATRGLVLAPARGGRAEAVYLVAPRLPWDAVQAAALAARYDPLLGPLLRSPVSAELGFDLAGTRLSSSPLQRATLAAWPGIELVGASAPRIVQAGRNVTVTLLWRAAGPTDRPLTTAIHLVSADGRRIAQADGRPLGGSPPTDRLAAGELISADHALAVADDADPGTASLAVGWYALGDDPDAPVDVRRTVDDRDMVAVAKIQVAAGRAAVHRPLSGHPAP